MQRSLEKDLATLELTGRIQQVVASVPESEEGAWKKRTEAFHELVKSSRKTQCRKWHPDVCSDPQAVERTAEINAAADGLLTIKFVPPQPQPLQVFYFGFGGRWSSSTSTSTTSWGTWF